jgi:hypothetical protein
MPVHGNRGAHKDGALGTAEEARRWEVPAQLQHDGVNNMGPLQCLAPACTSDGEVVWMAADAHCMTFRQSIRCTWRLRAPVLP